MQLQLIKTDDNTCEVLFEDKYYLKTTLMRLHEFCNCIVDNFRGRFFENEEILDSLFLAHTKEGKTNPDWESFTFDDKSFRSFLSIFQGKQMTKREKQFITLINEHFPGWRSNPEFKISISCKLLEEESA